LNSKSALPYVWMLLGSFSFAVMSELTYGLRTTFPWQVIALTRAALALFFASLLVRASGAQFVYWHPRTLWLRSLAGSFSLLSFFFALTRLPASEVLTLGNMFPIWVALLSWPMLGEPPSGRVWLSVACGISGVILIQQPHLAEGNFATLVALAASFFTAVAMIGLHRLGAVEPPAIVAHFSAVSLLFCIPTFFLFERTTEGDCPVTAGASLMLFGVGITATAGQVFLTRAFAAGTPAKVSVVGLTQVVFAMFFDALVWQRAFDSVTLLGIALVLAPTAWLLVHLG
jgi:drug/metabolite transporter (DMT)-like permease